MRSKCKRKRKWKCKRVHTSNANARRERYASAVEVFFQDGRQWLSFCRYTRAGSERRCKLKKVKSFLLLALTLAFALAFAFVEVLLVWLIDRGRCVYWPITLLAHVDVPLWNLKTSQINGWKVRRMFEFDVFRQQLFNLLKKILCHQILRSTF